MEILFLDDHFVAVSKPAGLLVHRSAVDRHETVSALQLTRDRVGRRVYPVHRLDRPTSGVLIFALSPEMAAILGAAFAARQAAKRYVAVVRGMAPEKGTIDYPLVEVPDRMTDRLARTGKVAQEAVTAFRRLAVAELPYPSGRHDTSRYSLVEARPLTGRKHQIRRHFKHLSHPVIGDTTHGDGSHNRLFREEFDCSRLLMHALALTILHPVTGERLTVTAPPDEEFITILERLGWRDIITHCTGEGDLWEISRNSEKKRCL
jgi:tRNA pseudouridine65 synthase